MNDVKFSQPDGINYKLTSEKGRYRIDLKINLMQLGVDIQAIPSVEDLDSIQVRKLIYFDGWSRDNFTNSLFAIFDASEMADLLFKKFTMDMNEKMRKG
jgi:hypothetical protein